MVTRWSLGGYAVVPHGGYAVVPHGGYTVGTRWLRGGYTLVSWVGLCGKHYVARGMPVIKRTATGDIFAPV